MAVHAWHLLRSHYWLCNTTLQCILLGCAGTHACHPQERQWCMFWAEVLLEGLTWCAVWTKDQTPLHDMHTLCCCDLRIHLAQH